MLRFLALLVACAPAWAVGADALLCAVSYQTPNGWSRESVVSVAFLMGQELNPPEGEYLVYVEIPNSTGGLGEVEGISVQTSVFTTPRFAGVFVGREAIYATAIEGRPRRWRIRARNGQAWIDPRLGGR